MKEDRKRICFEVNIKTYNTIDQLKNSRGYKSIKELFLHSLIAWIERHKEFATERRTWLHEKRKIIQKEFRNL